VPNPNTDRRPSRDPEDLEDELAAVLPDTQGPRFFPMLRSLGWHLVAFILLGAAAYILWREFHEISLAELAEAVAAWGWGSVCLAIILSATSFLLMGTIEWLGLRWAGARIALGANLTVSGAVRARYYAKHGVSLRQVAATTLFHGFSFAVGLSTLAGLALLFAGSHDIAAVSRIANPVADALGVTLLAAVAGYVVLCATLRRPLSGFGHSLRLPSARVAMAQLSVGAVDNAVAAAIVWVLLPEGSLGYLTFVGAYAPSVVVGLISHVPGGVGVFEGSVSTLLKGLSPAPLAAAFLGYRLFFFLLPLLIAGVALAVDTLRERRSASS